MLDEQQLETLAPCTVVLLGFLMYGIIENIELSITFVGNVAFIYSFTLINTNLTETQ